MKKKVLVVDNNPVIVTLLKNFLENHGHEVKAAENGLKALEVLEDFLPDVIFIDLIMPNINGKQLCRIIRSRPSFKHVVIAILSAAAAEEQTHFREFGADYCIAKGPFKEITPYLLDVLNRPLSQLGRVGGRPIEGVDNIYKRAVTKELLDINRHMEMILQNMSEGIVEVTETNKIIFSNSAIETMSGKKEAELLSTDLLTLFQAHDRDDIGRLVEDANRELTIKIMDRTVLLGDRHVLLHFLPTKDRRQKCFIVLVQDKTVEVERKAAVEQRLETQVRLAHASRLTALGELATGIVHEIRQPLTVIGLATQVLHNYFKNYGQATFESQSVQSIQYQIERITTIIANVQSFARAHGKIEQAVDLAEPLRRALSFFREQFRIHMIELQVRLEEPMPKVAANPQKFEQVVVNSLSNAKYAVDKRAEQAVGAYRKAVSVALYYNEQENSVFFEVKDNGAGMTEETRVRCLEPFYTTKPEGEGTGLGLSIVSEIVQEFNGRVEVESKEGAGTLFRVIMPPEVQNEKS